MAAGECALLAPSRVFRLKLARFPWDSEIPKCLIPQKGGGGEIPPSHLTASHRQTRQCVRVLRESTDISNVIQYFRVLLYIVESLRLSPKIAKSGITLPSLPDSCQSMKVLPKSCQMVSGLSGPAGNSEMSEHRGRELMYKWPNSDKSCLIWPHLAKS